MLVRPVESMHSRIQLNALHQTVQGQRSPVTEYFFWPRKDAWEELKVGAGTRVPFLEMCLAWGDLSMCLPMRCCPCAFLVKFAHAASQRPHGAYSCLTPRSLTSCTHLTTCRAQASLDTRSWIGEREKVLLLNQCTEVINYWQDENKHSLEEARKAFPNAKFQVRRAAWGL